MCDMGWESGDCGEPKSGGLPLTHNLLLNCLWSIPSIQLVLHVVCCRMLGGHCRMKMGRNDLIAGWEVGRRNLPLRSPRGQQVSCHPGIHCSILHGWCAQCRTTTGSNWVGCSKSRVGLLTGEVHPKCGVGYTGGALSTDLVLVWCTHWLAICWVNTKGGCMHCLGKGGVWWGLAQKLWHSADH